MESSLVQFLSTYPSRTFGKGQIILQPEHEKQHIFFISSGFVRAHTITEEGNEFSAAILGQGTYFPVFRYISDTTYLKKLAIKYCYSALSETKITSVRCSDFIHFLTMKPQIAVEMSDIYYFNMRLLQSKLEFMAYTHSAYKKVCYFLLLLSKKFGQETSNSIKIMPFLTHKEFSTFVGLSRESVSHQLSILKKKNILSECGQTIYIEKLQMLEDELRK